MKKGLVLLLLSFFFANNFIFSASFKITTDDPLETHSTQYFVKLAEGISNQEINNLMAELNSVELWRNDQLNLRLWAVKSFPYSCFDGDISDIEEHLVRSKKKTDIDEVTVDMIFELEATDYTVESSYFDNLNLQAAIGSNSIKISILDSGISDPAILNNSHYDGPTVYTGYDYIDNDLIPDDENGHGTHIAGVIHKLVSQSGASSNVSFDIRKTHDKNGLGNISDLIYAIVDAVDAGAHIINMSFSYYDKLEQGKLNPLQLAIDYAEENGVLVVASAGNRFLNNDNASGQVPIPASLPNDNIISVASNSGDESLSSFSNYGAGSVDVSILGESIPGPGLYGEKEYASGTSFSTAIVSALSAILGSRQGNFNACAIKCILINTSKPVAGLDGLNAAGGVIDFDNALQNPPSSCQSACQEPLSGETDIINCAPETVEMDICASSGETVTAQLLVYDPEEDAISITPDPVYGPFNGTATIHADGTFTYSSHKGEADMFVYQVCDDAGTGTGSTQVCSDGCNYGVVYINTVNCSSPITGGGNLLSNEFDIDMENANYPEDCVAATGQGPKILTLRYTGDACSASSHLQDESKVDCSGDPEYAPFVYVTVESGGKKSKIFFRDLQVPLGGAFDIDANSISRSKLESSVIIFLKDAQGEVLQEIEFHTSGSQPLGVGNQFGALVVEGYVAPDDQLCGLPPVSVVCPSNLNCSTMGSLSSIGLMYKGSTETTVRANGKSKNKEPLGSYDNVGPGDFILYSSLYGKKKLKDFYLYWGEDMEVRIPINAPGDLLGETFGDFQVVHLMDQQGNTCRIPFSSCVEVNRQCGEGPEFLALSPDWNKSLGLDNTNEPLFREKGVNLYPNPARDVVYLNLQDYTGQAVDIALYDPVSRLIKRVQIDQAGGAATEIKLDQLSNGVYTVIIQAEAEAPVSRKLVITRN